MAGSERRGGGEAEIPLVPAKFGVPTDAVQLELRKSEILERDHVQSFELQNRHCQKKSLS